MILNFDYYGDNLDSTFYLSLRYKDIRAFTSYKDFDTAQIARKGSVWRKTIPRPSEKEEEEEEEEAWVVDY